MKLVKFGCTSITKTDVISIIACTISIILFIIFTIPIRNSTVTFEITKHATIKLKIFNKTKGSICS